MAATADNTSNEVQFLFLTANVGSLFEDCGQLETGWLKEVTETLRAKKPGFFALHMQEVGGKESATGMALVNNFVTTFSAHCQELDYCDGCAYMDQDFTKDEKFTALGSVYFYHKSLQGNVSLWDFSEKRFEPLTGFTVHNENLSEVSTLCHLKFPPELFMTVKWSRKGFLKTRWKVNQLVLDLVNIHLFHDACNLVATETPQTFASCRHNGLQMLLDRLNEDPTATKVVDQIREKCPQTDCSTSETWMLPFFIFGDFNFRLDNRSFVKRLTANTHTMRLSDGANAESSKTPTRRVSTSVLESPYRAFEFRKQQSEACVLRIEKKVFDHVNHDDIVNKWPTFQDDDVETRPFVQRKQLYECPIAFPPSYPWVEDVKSPVGYMKTRAPAWCDRVLMNGSAWHLLQHQSKPPTDSSATVNNPTATYSIVGQETCMGDHKPVFLSMSLPTSADVAYPLMLRPDNAPLAKSEVDLSSFSQQQTNKSALSHTASSPVMMRNHQVAGSSTAVSTAPSAQAQSPAVTVGLYEVSGKSKASSEAPTKAKKSRTTTDKSLLDTVLSLEPVTEESSTNTAQVQKHYNVQSQLEYFVYTVMLQPDPNTFVSVVTLHDDMSATVQDASSSTVPRQPSTSSTAPRKQSKPFKAIDADAYYLPRPYHSLTRDPHKLTYPDFAPTSSEAVYGRSAARGGPSGYRPVGGVARDSMEVLPLTPPVSTARRQLNSASSWADHDLSLLHGANRSSPSNRFYYEKNAALTEDDEGDSDVFLPTAEARSHAATPVDETNFIRVDDVLVKKRAKGTIREQRSTSKDFSSIITIEDESGAPTIVYGRPASYASVKPQHSVDSATSVLSDNVFDTKSVVDHSIDAPSESALGDRTVIVEKPKMIRKKSVKFCQTDSKITGDENSLRRELAARKQMGVGQFRNNWRVMRELLSFDLCTMSLMQSNAQSNRPPSSTNTLERGPSRTASLGARSATSQSKKDGCALM